VLFYVVAVNTKEYNTDFYI